MVAVGPKRMAPSPTPVGWEQEPNMVGIFSALRTKAKAPHIASSTLARGSSATLLLDGQESRYHEGTHTAIPAEGPGDGKIALRNVHGPGWYCEKDQRQGHQGTDFPCRTFHTIIPFSFSFGKDLAETFRAPTRGPLCDNRSLSHLLHRS